METPSFISTKALLLVSCRSCDRYVTFGIAISRTLVHSFHNNSFHIFIIGLLIPRTFVQSFLVHPIHYTSFHALLIGRLVPLFLVHSHSYFVLLTLCTSPSYTHPSCTYPSCTYPSYTRPSTLTIQKKVFYHTEACRFLP